MTCILEPGGSAGTDEGLATRARKAVLSLTKLAGTTLAGYTDNAFVVILSKGANVNEW